MTDLGCGAGGVTLTSIIWGTIQGGGASLIARGKDRATGEADASCFTGITVITLFANLGELHANRESLFGG